jgi:transcriptional/translational regulatory protein YebC/TACO1
LIVYTDQKDLAKVRTAIVEDDMQVADAELQYVPKNQVEISDSEQAAKVLKLMDALDDLDDVVNVHTNAEITAEI